MKHVKLKDWKAECPKCQHIEMAEGSNPKCANCNAPAIMTYESEAPKRQTQDYLEARKAGTGRRLECSQGCGWTVYRINCSKCGAVIGGKFFKGKESFVMHCFVATSAFNDIEHPVVEALRNYRDEILMNSKTGRAFIGFYYTHGESWGNWLDKKPSLKPVLRLMLTLFVKIQK